MTNWNPGEEPKQKPQDAVENQEQVEEPQAVEETTPVGTSYTFTSHRGLALLIAAHRGMEPNEENIQKIVDALPSTMNVGDVVNDKDVVID